MTDEAKKVVNALNDATIMCAECQYYGEPNGCNRVGGSCNAWDYAEDAADLIEQLSEELERVKQERDAAVYDLAINRSCAVCKNEGGFKCKANGCAKTNEWQWRGICAENCGGIV